MESDEAMITRRMLLAGGCQALRRWHMRRGPWAIAKLPNCGMKALIGGASNGALDKLVQPAPFLPPKVRKTVRPGIDR